MCIINILRQLFNLSSKLIGPKFFSVQSYDIALNNINIRVYTPYDNSNSTKPVILYYHGGGWIIGSIQSYDNVLRYISRNAACIVVAVEYRKSPEYKFPTALEDAYAGYCWVIDNISKIQGDIHRLILCGDSAGGNLAMGLLKILNKKKKVIRPYLLLLIYPLLEINITNVDNKPDKNCLVYKITEKILKFCLRQYFTASEKKTLPYVSFIDNFDPFMLNLPITLVITAELDSLTPGINKYFNMLKAMGNNIIIKEYPRVLHGFINFSRISKQAELALKSIVDTVTSVDSEHRNFKK